MPDPAWKAGFVSKSDSYKAWIDSKEAKQTRVANHVGRKSSLPSGIPLSTRVNTLVIDPATPTTLYAGTFGGGVFKSLDSATTWSAVNAGLTDLAISTLAIDPTTPMTLYAGEFGPLSKSTNAGATWSPFGEDFGLTSFVDSLAIGSVYAGTGGGVFKLLSITEITPMTEVVAGQQITLNGTGFTGTTGVTIKGLAATFMVVDDGTIIVTVPPGLNGTAADIVVTQPAGSTTQQGGVLLVSNIPTLSNWGLLLLLITLGIAGVCFLRP